MLRYFKYALVGVVCVAIIFVVWYAIVAGRSNTEAPDFKDNNTPTVEGNNDAGKQDSDDNKNSNTDDKNEDDKKAETPTVEITKNGELDYSIKLDPSMTTFKFKMEFVGRTWSQLNVNGSDYSGFKSGIYNNANKSNATDAAPEIVELDIPVENFQNLELKLGYFMGHHFYINDQPLEIDASEYDGGNHTLKITRVQ